jgi:hypothetical protein
MKNLSAIHAVLRFASGSFGCLYILLVLCFLSLMSWRYAAWLVSAVAVAILYSLPPKVLCRSSFTIRLAFMLFCAVIIGFIAVSFFAVSKLGTGPVLLGGTEEFGSSRNWGIGIAIFMTLCALAGPINLLLNIKTR